MSNQILIISSKYLSIIYRQSWIIMNNYPIFYTSLLLPCIKNSFAKKKPFIISYSKHHSSLL